MRCGGCSFRLSTASSPFRAPEFSYAVSCLGRAPSRIKLTHDTVAFYIGQCYLHSLGLRFQCLFLDAVLRRPDAARERLGPGVTGATRPPDFCRDQQERHAGIPRCKASDCSEYRSFQLTRRVVPPGQSTDRRRQLEHQHLNGFQRKGGGCLAALCSCGLRSSMASPTHEIETVTRWHPNLSQRIILLLERSGRQRQDQDGSAGVRLKPAKHPWDRGTWLRSPNTVKLVQVSDMESTV